MEIETNHTPESKAAAEYFRRVLTDALNCLLDQVEYHDRASKFDDVKESLRNITKLYKTGLSRTSCRSNWDDAANRCAYVFTYFMQHCHIVHYSLQQVQHLFSESWQNNNRLIVCSIGGGPGSDLVGLTRFLQDADLFPPSLTCVVLDLYPNWKHAWESIYNQLPETFDVTYRKCDLVNTTALQKDTLSLIGQAHMLTFVKSFSAIAAFLRQDPRCGSRLRAILRELKEGSFVLYIDNKHWDKSFLNNFALPAGLKIVFDFCGKQSLPFGNHSHTIREFCHHLDFRPMRNCDVTIWILYKTKSAQSKVQSSNLSTKASGPGHSLSPLRQQIKTQQPRLHPAHTCSCVQRAEVSQSVVPNTIRPPRVQPRAAPKLSTSDASYKYVHQTAQATSTDHHYSRREEVVHESSYVPQHPQRTLSTRNEYQPTRSTSRHLANEQQTYSVSNQANGRISAWNQFKRCICCTLKNDTD